MGYFKVNINVNVIVIVVLNRMCCILNYRGIEWVNLNSFLSFSFPNPGTNNLVKNEVMLVDVVSGRSFLFVCVPCNSDNLLY